MASANEIPYPLTLFMMVLPKAFGFVTKDVKIMKVVDTGILRRVRISKMMVHAVYR